MNKLLLLCATPIAFSSCVPAVEGQVRILDPSQEQELQLLCRKLHSLGDANSLAGSIKEKIQEILRLLKRPHPERFLEEVRHLKREIQACSKRLRSMLGPEFSDVRYSQQILWEIDAEAERKLRKPEKWRLIEYRLEAAYHPDSPDRLEDDELHQELLAWTSAERTAEGVRFRYQRPTTALDLCQLQEGLGMKALLVFEDRDGDRKNERFQLIAKPWREK